MTAPRATEAADLRRIGLAAKQVGISTDTLYRAIKRGLLVRHKQGSRMTFVSMAQVNDWIAAGDKVGKVE